jgi:hypothetical protein
MGVRFLPRRSDGVWCPNNNSGAHTDCPWIFSTHVSSASCRKGAPQNTQSGISVCPNNFFITIDSPSLQRNALSFFCDSDRFYVRIRNRLLIQSLYSWRCSGLFRYSCILARVRAISNQCREPLLWVRATSLVLPLMYLN